MILKFMNNEDDDDDDGGWFWWFFVVQRTYPVLYILYTVDGTDRSPPRSAPISGALTSAIPAPLSGFSIKKYPLKTPMILSSPLFQKNETIIITEVPYTFLLFPQTREKMRGTTVIEPSSSIIAFFRRFPSLRWSWSSSSNKIFFIIIITYYNKEKRSFI